MKLKTVPKPDGFSEYTTVDGDLVDDLAFRFYGNHDDTTELLYAANPHLLQLSMILPAGQLVRFPPAKPRTATKSQINLWD